MLVLPTEISDKQTKHQPRMLVFSSYSVSVLSMSFKKKNLIGFAQRHAYLDDSALSNNYI